MDACTSHDLTGEGSGQWLVAREEALKIARDAMVAAQARQTFYADRREEIVGVTGRRASHGTL